MFPTLLLCQPPPPIGKKLTEDRVCVTGKGAGCGSEEQARPFTSDPAVEGFEQREESHLSSPVYHNYGSIGGGYDGAKEAWHGLERLCYVERGLRPPKKLLKKHPVELLAVERGHWGRPGLGQDITREWRELILECLKERRPDTIVEMWPGSSTLWENGPLSKGSVKRWALLGYTSRGKLVSALEVGGAIDQTRLILIRTVRLDVATKDWPGTEERGHDRPMSNLLTPPGLVGRRRWRKTPIPKGTRVWDPQEHPMPWKDHVGVLPWVVGPYGVRRLTWEEIGKGLGLPKEDLTPSAQAGRVLSTTSVFHWEYVGQMLAPGENVSGLRKKVTAVGLEDRARFASALPDYPVDEPSTVKEGFDWKPPPPPEGRGGVVQSPCALS